VLCAKYSTIGVAVDESGTNKPTEAIAKPVIFNDDPT